MGQAPSTVYKLCRKALIRYNANFRAERFLDKGQLPTAPRHPSHVNPIEIIPKSDLKKIHEKNEQLNEYLKKVYLTSTSTVVGTPSKRPKPKKENEIKALQNPIIFVEPKQPQPHHVTLSNIVDILFNFHEDSKQWNVKSVTRNYNLDKADVDAKEKENEPKKVTFEVYSLLEKKPLRQIEGKK